MMVVVVVPEAVSAEALLFLFADRVVERSRLTSRLGGNPGCPVPAGGLVKLGALEQMLCAWSLWGLHRSGEVRLELAAHTTGVRAAREWVTGIGGAVPRVQMVTTGVVSDGRNDTLGAELRRAMVGRQTNVYSTVLEWAVARNPLPLFGVVRVVRGEARHLDVVIGELNQPSWWRRRSFNRVLASSDVNTRKLRRLEGSFADANAEWQAFGANDQALQAGLLRDVKRALAAGRPTTTSAPGSPPGP